MSGTGRSSPPADAVGVTSLCHRYGAAESVRGVSFAVPRGGLLTLLGPSGCGKTTLLKLVGGYLTPTSGRVELGGVDVTALPPERRGAGMVFQNYALFPHLSAWRNVAFGLEVRGVSAAEVRRRVEGMLARVGLSAAEAARSPAQLSGGQQQRVALARALVIEPAVLLLDEPLANLDRHLRESLRGELRAIQRSAGVAALLVTHDQEEALALSDLVGVMRGGRLLQLGTPEEVYHRPRCQFVARFLGEANLIDGAALGMAAGLVMVRPERIGVVSVGGIAGRIVSSSFLGAAAVLDVDCGAFRLKVRWPHPLPAGAELRLHIPADAVWPIPEGDPE